MKMNIVKKVVYVLLVFMMVSCAGKQSNKAILSKVFDASGWEKFEPVAADVEVSKSTTYDLSLLVTFAEDYAYRDFSVVFTVFDESGEPYRAKSYSFRLKDSDDNWNVDRKGSDYEFVFPINSSLSLTEVGKYRFQLDSRMPITPLYGIRKVELINNK